MTTDTRRRVKLYALNADRQWDDRGTGHVTSSYVDRVKGVSLLVHAENDGSMLLESKIHPDTTYHKQQDTLIVWSEGDNFDLALSFQEKAGCDEIWEKICQVQGKDPSVEITQESVEESEDERFEDMSDSAPPIELPPCELSRLEDISEVIASALTSAIRKDKLAQAIESENYIKKLLGLFHVCEDLDNQEGLHYLYEIFKNIFLLNKNGLFEIMFAEDTIFDVVGCLEYDPSGNPPKNHRQYLRKLVKFREAIPIRNTDLLAKIHQTFRVQYIQDIVLPTPSVFEDNMLNTLSSFIFFNKVEIVTLIQEDDKFLDDLFALLTDPQTPDSKRRDSILFLKEFCNFAQYLQPQGKETFFKTLISLGVLPALEITLAINEKRTKAASIDILSTIVEYSPSVVRDYTLQQYNNSDSDEDQTLINIAIEQLLSDSEPEVGGAVQLITVLRILLDPENMLSSANKSEKSDFLNFFYKHSIQTLIAPLLRHTQSDKPTNEDYHVVQLLSVVLDILSFCVEHHTYHIKNCIINKDLLRKVLVLMNSAHTFLVLGALRFLRKIVSLKDEFYNRHIVKGNLFAPIVEAFIRNDSRYNLLESAILELFEFIRLEDIKSLYTYFVESFGKFFDDVQYVQTFKTLKSKYDQQQDRLKEKEKGNLESVPSILRNSSRYRRDQRQMDEDEEIWFNEEEDYAEAAGKSGAPELDSTIGKMFEKKAMDTTSSLNGPKYGSGAVSTAQSHQLSSQMHGGVTATATSADDVAATSHMLTINNGTEGGNDENVAASAAHLQSASLDPNCLSQAVAQAAAAAAAAVAVANNNGLPSSSSSSVTVESVSSLGEIGHEHLQHHKEHHRVLVGEDDATAANLTPADESALDDANSLAVSALGGNDLSAVYQLQPTTGAAAVSSTVVASSACETTASTTLSSIPVTETCSSSSSYTDATAITTAPEDCSSSDAAAAAVTVESSGLVVGSSTIAVDSSSALAGVESLGGAVEETVSKRLSAEGLSDRVAQEVDTEASAGGGSSNLESDESKNHDGVEQKHPALERGMEKAHDGAASSTSDDANDAEMVSMPAASPSSLIATPPILDSAPAVEQPTSGTAPAAEQDSLSSAAASVASSTSTTMVSGLKKGLVDYEGDSDEDEDDDDSSSPAQKKARIA
ncbi:serine/threonine-protein phosphatase 4 regulatory subunit 3 [Anopheles stephensi]|uniref:serine/threonine-protein phosphatase 4 regulatory subunit 3 n=1 Tax=Anopheles stephensi TaxID=30069 RepID=UPI001658B3B0|nr:serine/threonine-protein phosphatase 4 regulatory subunit 3 [Anopheles stephensi]XP_035900272.1 serine/threonine-protein phosphatase 4 regulatory subunit 3 [Anopheles stephensi]XP_035900274.1 serine/threonine-protein phosphatase 4 regulatory subunit 3 [Anopheles stephensi]XP_035900275.1 serine/threonine-protein phosphatase 4 regulatory subunit 3 [Anopheles stephensi]XP_035900276.1 serine/threonine-protein phosphatase 4 regulatory subunit 3 [Anopheles stephensi]XP_035900277.1 serine/threonin